MEPVAAYLQLAEQLWLKPAIAGAYNFGPETQEAATVQNVVKLAQEAYGKGQVSWGDGTIGHHEAGCLTLEIAKARAVLGVRPCWSLVQAVHRTMKWYLHQLEGADVRTLCEADIFAFEEANLAVHVD